MKKGISLILAIVYIFSSIIIPVNASSISKTKQKQQQIKNQISDVKKQKQAIQDGLKQKSASKQQLESAAKKTQSGVQKKKEEVSDVNNDISRIKKEITDIDQDYKKKTELFKTRMRVMYQNMNKSPLETFVESKDFSEFFMRLQLMSMVKKNDEKLINEISMSKENTELRKQQKYLELKKKQQQLKELNGKASEIKTSRALLDSDIESDKSKLKDLEKKEDEMLQLSKQLEDDLKKLMDTKAKYAGGVMAWPTPGYTSISSPFGYRIHPIYKVRKMHTGIDIDAPMGASIIAANSGRVILAGWNGGYGNCVIIDHGDGIATLYGHQSRLLVNVGDKVSKGDVIGKVGTTGLSTGPHLHFEVRINGKPTDPRKYV